MEGPVYWRNPTVVYLIRRTADVNNTRGTSVTVPLSMIKRLVVESVPKFPNPFAER
jgi:hypothetical protein